MADHSESMQVDFDPARLSFAALVDEVFASHDPFARRSSHSSRQYLPGIWWHDDAQRATIEAKVAALEARAAAKKRPSADARVTTLVGPARDWFDAEGYHQKYYLQSNSRLAKLVADCERHFRRQLATQQKKQQKRQQTNSDGNGDHDAAADAAADAIGMRRSADISRAEERDVGLLILHNSIAAKLNAFAGGNMDADDVRSQLRACPEYASWTAIVKENGSSADDDELFKRRSRFSFF